MSEVLVWHCHSGSGALSALSKHLWSRIVHEPMTNSKLPAPGPVRACGVPKPLPLAAPCFSKRSHWGRAKYMQNFACFRRCCWWPQAPSRLLQASECPQQEWKFLFSWSSWGRPHPAGWWPAVTSLVDNTQQPPSLPGAWLQPHPSLGSPCPPCVTLPWSAARIGDILGLQGQWLESDSVIAHRARLCLVILFLELSKRRINSYSLVWFRAEHPLDAHLQSWPVERANLLFQVYELLQQARAGIVVHESAAALWHVDKGLWVLSALQRFPSTMRSDCRLIPAQQCALSILLSWVKLIMRLT